MGKQFKIDEYINENEKDGGGQSLYKTLNNQFD